MGIKSKSNYRINLCLKEDCVARPFKCDECIAYSHYARKDFGEDFRYCTCKHPTSHSAGTLPNRKDLIICNACGGAMKI